MGYEVAVAVAEVLEVPSAVDGSKTMLVATV